MSDKVYKEFKRVAKTYSLCFKFVSFCRKSIPSDGSPAQSTETFLEKVLACESQPTIEKIINHRDGSTTIKTTGGFFRFF